MDGVGSASVNLRREAEMSAEASEPRMRVRDADLRGVVHERGAGPGTDLYRLLVELQRRRDAASSRSTPRERVRSGEGAGA